MCVGRLHSLRIYVRACVVRREANFIERVPVRVDGEDICTWVHENSYRRASASEHCSDNKNAFCADFPLLCNCIVAARGSRAR